MHLSVNNHDTSTSILSIKETIGIVVVFIFVLYLIFPKRNLEHLLTLKGENTNLSINYLESMLLYYPKNIKLELILLKNYDYANKRDKAFKLIKKILSQTKDIKVLDEVYRIEYRLLKEIYFEKKDKKLLSKIEKKLYNYFEFSKGNRDYLYFFAEATQMGFDKLKYIALKGLIETKPQLVNYKLEKEAYYLALALGYKKEANEFMLRLTKYPEMEDDFKNSLLSIFLSQKDYRKVIDISTKLFQKEQDITKKENYFNIALYATSMLGDRNQTVQLINLYRDNVDLNSHNIYFIIDNLLKIEDIAGASQFAIKNFQTNWELFDENCSDLAIKAMIYNQDLESALTLAKSAQKKFHNKKWLDEAIKLSLWQGKIKEAVALNIKGYREYKDIKYERYLLDNTSLNMGYKILGEIYKNKIEKRNYKFIDKLAQYFDYIANINEAEEFFTKLYKKRKNPNILKKTILFSFQNNHYKKGIKLYMEYKNKFGIDQELQILTIDRLMALKKFKKAYKLLKDLEKNSKHFKEYKRLIDLAWIEKDYKYIYNILWKLEKRAKLDNWGYSKLVQLEKEINNNKNIAYLYKKMFKKSRNISYILGLLYLYSDEKDYDSFKKAINLLTPKEKKVLTKNINYHILLANYYINKKELKSAINSFNKAFKIDKNNPKLYQAYLWFLIDNQLKNRIKKEITLLKNRPRLRKKVGFPSIVGAMLDKQNELALQWIEPFKNKNREYKELYKELKVIEHNKIQALLDRYSPNSKILKRYTQLSKKILSIEDSFSYKLELYNNIEAKLSLKKYRYKLKNKNDIKDNIIGLFIKNSNNNLLWDISINTHNNSLNNFLSALFNISYKMKNTIIKINPKYQNKTVHTTQLNVKGIENSLTLSATELLTDNLNLTFSYQNAEYKLLEDNSKAGELNQFKLVGNYTLKRSYPDIIIGSYILNNHYNNIQNNLLPKDFIELGGELNIGITSLDRLHREFRPFGTLSFTINDHNQIGTALKLGVSGEINGGDIFSLTFKYSKEIDGINKPYYGIGIDYRF